MSKQILTKSSRIRPIPTYEYLLLIIVTIIAGSLRLYKLGEWSFWIDELYTIRDALGLEITDAEMLLLKDPIIGPIRAGSISYFLVRSSLSWFGISEWSARIFPAIIGAASIPILYFPIKKTVGITTAFVAVFLLAISPWHLWMSQNARYYSLLMLMYTLALMSLYLGLKNPRYFLLSLVFLVLASRERDYALMFVPVAFCYFVLLKILSFKTPQWLNWRNIIVVALMPAIGYTLYSALEVFYFDTDNLISELIDKFLGLPSMHPRWILTETITEVGIPLICLALAGSIYQLREKNQIGLLLVVGAVVPVLTLILLAPLFYLNPFYTLITLPCWIMLGALGLKEIFFRHKERINIIILVLGIMILLSTRDRVVKDVMFYFSEDIGTILLLILGIFIVILIVGQMHSWVIELIGRCNFAQCSSWLLPGMLKTKGLSSQTKENIVMLASMLIVVLVVAHPLAADTIYFRYQHGKRNMDHKTVMEMVQASMVDAGIILSVNWDQPRIVAPYYFGERIRSADSVDFEALVRERKKFWFVRQEFVHDYSEIEANTSPTEKWVGRELSANAFITTLRKREFILAGHLLLWFS